MHRIVKSVCCIHETITTLYVNYTSIIIKNSLKIITDHHDKCKNNEKSEILLVLPKCDTET